MLGRWEFATHGGWLGLDDMEALWSPDENGPWIQAIHRSQRAAEEHWGNDAAALFRPETLSLFACSDLNYERVYLLWLDYQYEPEVWAYDANGESRYKDIADYLRAYIGDDLRASQRRWKLAEIAEQDAKGGN